ncbi:MULTISPECIES: TRAP transporter large permease [Marinovum]|uniref:TRAP transporter large permease protein n=1 Tax=Marinovum algicola TaxID=42444 RepID=A0A975WCA8_9RHOB|nr:MULTISPECIES: TRAP transporter large permease [Marinovum]MDD9739841.1 TRAP transporter large permease [Marinovum sp. SP66]SEJ89300.1 TRAP transporter, DctM subunit [Marinovum algicola]SLN45687.1 Sialic acid TRAP transporter permease protein SiaT [Marinovum algicola]
MTGLSFLVLLGTGMPIAFVLIATTFVFLYMADRLPVLDAVPQIAFGSVETFDLLAIPLFVMLGEIMNEGGLTRRIFRAARAWLTRVRHDLPLVNLIANLALAAIMGSATAQIAVMSRTVVPEMEKAGYGRGYSTAITAAAGLLGPIIPPSMILIIFGVIAQVSIADMFRAGIVPGLILFALMLGLTLWQASRNQTHGAATRPVETSRIKASLPGLATMLIPFVIVGGISFGVFTPTESAAVAIVVALILGGPVFRDLTWKSLPAILDRTVQNSAIVLFLIMAAKVFGWVLTFNQIPQAVAAFIASLTQDPTIFMILVMLSLVAVGMFLDGIAALIIMVPILLPVATATYGIDPVQFGIMVSMTLVLGLLTPPVGAGLYIAAAISEVPITRLSKLVAPYVLASVLVIFIVILFPWVVRPF